jgi:hypothetical protein
MADFGGIRPAACAALESVPREITVGMTLEGGGTIDTKDDGEAHANMAGGAYLAVRAGLIRVSKSPHVRQMATAVTDSGLMWPPAACAP